MQRCRYCGLDYGGNSMGGPGICPACDCGVPPEVSRLRARVAQLEAEKNATYFIPVPAPPLSDARVERAAKELRKHIGWMACNTGSPGGYDFKPMARAVLAAAVARAERADADCERFKRDMLALDESRMTAVSRAERAEAELVSETARMEGEYAEVWAERNGYRASMDAALARVREAEKERDRLRKQREIDAQEFQGVVRERQKVIEYMMAHPELTDFPDLSGGDDEHTTKLEAAARAEAVRGAFEWIATVRAGIAGTSDCVALDGDELYARYLVTLAGKEPSHV